MSSAPQPIQYRDLVDIRFADLDFYGHVNSKHYVDLVSTARLTFLERELKISIQEVTQRGIGFFLVKSEIHYKRPIVGLQRVLATSFVESVRDGSILEIPFVLSTADGSRVFSDGRLEFALIDMKTMRKTTAPEWVEALFFQRPTDPDGNSK